MASFKANTISFAAYNKTRATFNSLVIAFCNNAGLILQRISIKMAHFSKVLSLSLQISNAILKERKQTLAIKIQITKVILFTFRKDIIENE